MQIRRALVALSIGILTALGLVVYGGVASATDPASSTGAASVTTMPSCPDDNDGDTDGDHDGDNNWDNDWFRDGDKDKDKDKDKHKVCPSSSSASPSASESESPKESPTASAVTTSAAALPTTGSNDVPTFAALGAASVLLGGLVVLLGLRRRRDASTS